MLYKNLEIFFVHVSALEATTIHPSQAAQIAALQWDKAHPKILTKYANYAYIFSSDLGIELFENTSITKYAIKSIEDKQLFYKPIYTLSPVKLKTLKIYIEIYLKTRFIQLSKSLTAVSILLDKKSDNNICLCVNYQSLNSLTIKNWYFLPLIGESLDWLDWAK